jgi:adenylate cyclase
VDLDKYKIMSNPYLEWLDENQQNQRIEIIDRICVGRTCRGIDPKRRILLDDPRVSRDHAEIRWTSGNLHIVDNSSNGTWVNDIRMTAGSSKDLSDGDTIRVGFSLFRVICPTGAIEVESDQPLTELTKVSPLEAVVTTLVADVRGFTVYSQSHPSSDVYGMIKEIFNRCSNIVEDFNGAIKDFAGDAIFAFWEHRFEDAATQSSLACQAAFRQKESLSDIRVDLTQRYPDIESLQMGWGITTGPTILSHFGSRSADLALVGDCINLASRLSGMANKEIFENILICSCTAELVKDQFAVKDLGRFAIRGREGMEHIFALSDA